jgi:predicted  nucleic acid-binding Zn-ribbon protein
MITARNAYYEETQNLKDLMERIAERGTQLKTLDLEIEAAESEIAKIEEKIPVLEKEKKIAATARNFLEANKLAKEIKDRKDESDGIGLKRNELKDQRERMIREIPEQDRLTLEMKGRITELKKCFDISSFRILEQRVADSPRHARVLREHDLPQRRSPPTPSRKK